MPARRYSLKEQILMMAELRKKAAPFPHRVDFPFGVGGDPAKAIGLLFRWPNQDERTNTWVFDSELSAERFARDHQGKAYVEVTQ